MENDKSVLPPDQSPPASPPASSRGKRQWPKFVILIIAFFLFVVLMGRRSDNSHSPYAPDSPAVVWSDDYDSAVKLARQENKPVLIAFHAGWCPPCKEMKRTTYHDPQVIKTAEQFVTIMVDTDRQGTIAEKFGVSGIPAYVITTPDGKVISQFAGYMPPEEFIRALTSALQKIQPPLSQPVTLHKTEPPACG